MKYLKKQLDREADEVMRENISKRDSDVKAMSDQTEGACDFCADAVPVCVYAASQMSTGEMRQCWRWTACIRCARLIDHGNWDALQRRVAARFKRLFAARLATLENKFKRPVSDDLIREAVETSLQQFHDYAVHIMETGTGKTGGKNQ